MSEYKGNYNNAHFNCNEILIKPLAMRKFEKISGEDALKVLFIVRDEKKRETSKVLLSKNIKLYLIWLFYFRKLLKTDKQAV